MGWKIVMLSIKIFFFFLSMNSLVNLMSPYDGGKIKAVFCKKVFLKNDNNVPNYA